MTLFEREALNYLIWCWRAAKACAAQQYPATFHGAGDMGNPWNHLNVGARNAICAAEEAGIWPDDLPLPKKPAVV